MTDPTTFRPLVAFLRERGHTGEEIELVLSRVRKYDQSMTVDSLMDAISSGEVDIAALIKDAGSP